MATKKASGRRSIQIRFIAGYQMAMAASSGHQHEEAGQGEQGERHPVGDPVEGQRDQPLTVGDQRLRKGRKVPRAQAAGCQMTKGRFTTANTPATMARYRTTIRTGLRARPPCLEDQPRGR